MNSSKRKSFDIVMVTPNDRCVKTLDYLIKNSILDHEIYLIDNGATALGYDLGSYRDFVKLSIPHDTLKIPEVYNKAWALTTTDFVAFLHNDTIVLELGWDVKMEEYLTKETGVAGFCGSTGYGDEKIYIRPFENADVARIDFRWNFNNPEVRAYAKSCTDVYDDRWLKSHGENLDTPLGAAVVDGLAMIINRKAFDEIGGFDERFTFQGFDENLCLAAISRGYWNYMVNIKYFHEGNGGASSYLRLLEANGVRDEFVTGDMELEDGIHRIACRLLYENWRGLLPLRELSNDLWKRI